MAAWINTARLFRTVSLRLRESAPCKGEIPEVQNGVLCGGCISLSNAEGLGKGLRPPLKLPADTPRTPTEPPPEQVFSGHKKAACLKSDISVPKQTATITPLFAAFRLLFVFIMQALMPALNHAAFYGCPLSLFCSLLATLCSCFLKIWLHFRLIMAISIKIRLR